MEALYGFVFIAVLVAVAWGGVRFWLNYVRPTMCGSLQTNSGRPCRKPVNGRLGRCHYHGGRWAG
jgi:hypothetical protein